MVAEANGNINDSLSLVLATTQAQLVEVMENTNEFLDPAQSQIVELKAIDGQDKGIAATVAWDRSTEQIYISSGTLPATDESNNTNFGPSLMEFQLIWVYSIQPTNLSS